MDSSDYTVYVQSILDENGNDGGRKSLGSPSIGFQMKPEDTTDKNFLLASKVMNKQLGSDEQMDENQEGSTGSPVVPEDTTEKDDHQPSTTIMYQQLGRGSGQMDEQSQEGSTGSHSPVVPEEAKVPTPSWTVPVDFLVGVKLNERAVGGSSSNQPAVEVKTNAAENLWDIAHVNS